ncbi:PadR family transcriptional regulator [Nocardia goodfellowii]|uniref:DNA-binding PadR family transcriptional regulator n=1 Tax=Nocardia goodfellowii TaxID=882446 RepID=A0ABS4QDX6_9NOCA|nr:PadR family transcriptional regulator [Nocardia goodfellowii]MBP2189884.1 DNA-binding PadR family transcriptional regulator [Nocardia goodfellowii]
MSDFKLSPTSYLVLSLVARTGPCTPFDIKKHVDRSIGFFWSFPHSQIYAEPERLAGKMLLSGYQEPAGRRRRIYSITDLGRARLEEWLSHSADAPTHELRDSGLLKLYFGSLSTHADVAKVAEAEKSAHQQRLDRYRTAHTSLSATPKSDVHELLVLEFGIRYESLAVEFWDTVADRPN